VWKRLKVPKISYASFALFVGIVAAIAAIYTTPQVQRFFHEDDRETVDRLGYSWSKIGFAEAWQQNDTIALNAFVDGGFVIDNEIFLSILRDDDRSAPYFMSFSRDLIHLISRSKNFSPRMCEVPRDDILDANYNWLDKVISDCERSSTYIAICTDHMDFEERFEYSWIRRNLMKTAASYENADERVDYSNQLHRARFLSELRENAEKFRCASAPVG
jgi:hypothetical protein